jgi:hypothetical protein
MTRHQLNASCLESAVSIVLLGKELPSLPKGRFYFTLFVIRAGKGKTPVCTLSTYLFLSNSTRHMYVQRGNH